MAAPQLTPTPAAIWTGEPIDYHSRVPQPELEVPWHAPSEPTAPRRAAATVPSSPPRAACPRTSSATRRPIPRCRPPESARALAQPPLSAPAPLPPPLVLPVES